MIEYRPTKYPGYFAGTDGFVWSQHHGNKGIQPDRPMRQLKAHPSTKSKYLNVVLTVDKRHINVRVHRAVCEAFHGPPPTDEHQASHRDDNHLNNHPDNLLWETPLENMRRRIENGIDDCGHRNSRAKLSEEQITQLREILRIRALTDEQVGEMFGVSRLFITKVNNGHRYSR